MVARKSDYGRLCWIRQKLYKRRQYIREWHHARAPISLNVALTHARADNAQATFSAKPQYKPYCFDQPTSHFDPKHNATFCHRYWIDASSYKPGGPIFLLDGGETSGADRYVQAGLPGQASRDMELTPGSHFFRRASLRSCRMRQTACQSSSNTGTTASLYPSRLSRPMTSAS